MFLIRNILDLLRRHCGLDGGSEYAEALRRLNRPSEVTLTPSEAVAAARRLLRGTVGSRAVRAHPDWLWPHWIARQIDPASADHTPLGPVLVNTTHRNWTVLGTPGGPLAAVVDPRGAVMPWEDGWTLETYLRVNRQMTGPAFLPEELVTQSLTDGVPAVETRFAIGHVGVTLRAEMLRQDDQSFVIHSAAVSNRSQEPCALELVFAIRPWNPDGISLLRHLAYNTKGFWLAGDSLMLFMPQRPDLARAASRERGDAAAVLANGLDDTQVHCEAGLATGATVFRLRLAPGETVERTAVMPATPVNPRFFRFHEFTPQTVQVMRSKTKDDWQAVLARGLTLTLPDQRHQMCFEASRAHLLARAGLRMLEHTPLGDHGIRLRRATTFARALDAAGHHEQAEALLRAMTTLQWQNGYFCGRLGEWDVNGRLIGAMAEHWRLTGNGAFLEAVFRAAERAAVWIEKKRHDVNITPRKPRGLLPAGFAQEDDAPNDFFYCDNFWSLRGLQDAAAMAGDLDRSAERDLLAGAAASYTRDIAEAINRDMEHRTNRLLGAAPFRPFSPLARENLCALYPLQLYSPATTPWLAAALQEAAGPAAGAHGIRPAERLRVAHSLMLAGHPDALRVAQETLTLATATWCWPTAIHPRTRGGCVGDGHDLCASAEWLLFARAMLLREDGMTLLITPLLPAGWIQPGQRVAVTLAPTHFGVVSFSVEFTQTGAALSLTADWRNPPAAVIWHSPAGRISLPVQSPSISARADTAANRTFSL